MEPHLFSKLSEQEKNELSLCGISSPEQLARTSVEQIVADLHRAEEFFPERQFVLSRPRIQGLHDICVAEFGPSSESESSKEFSIRNVGPTTGFRYGHRKKESPKIERQIKKYHQKKILHSAVRTNHPVLAFFAAIGTLLLVIPTISIFVLPVLMATDNLPDIPLPLLAIGLIVIPCLPYLFISRAATCPVCHMRLFTFRDYARNRAANHIPGLGYNVATALHILFCLRYSCPGCGTPVKLTGKKGHRTNH